MHNHEILRSSLKSHELVILNGKQMATRPEGDKTRKLFLFFKPFLLSLPNHSWKGCHVPGSPTISVSHEAI